MRNCVAKMMINTFFACNFLLANNLCMQFFCCGAQKQVLPQMLSSCAIRRFQKQMCAIVNVELLHSHSAFKLSKRQKNLYKQRKNA